MNKVFRISLVLAACIAWLFSCNNNGNKKFTDKNIEQGYLLSQTQCKSCHQFPEPVLLNKATWANHVLPKMGELVGFRYLGLNHYVENGKPSLLKLEQWNDIVKYYTTQSPDEPLKGEENNIKMELRQFKMQLPFFGVGQPATTLVNAAASTKNFYFGDGLTEQVYIVAANSTAVDSFRVGKGVAALHVTDTAWLALSMGVLQPSDSREGKLVSINRLKRNTNILLDSLQRPVHVTYADLNNDKLTDITVCEFGNNTGQLAWYQNNGNQKYIKHTLRPLPGAIRTEVYDFNKDGLQDIMALMAQADEGIFIYYNQGNNVFKEVRVLQLPPSYGSNYFELADFNKDGYPDIMATNGDNGDYPPILKAYHGIRIYMNDGKNNFKEKIFLHVNGVGKGIAKDFDSDGDLDIASIAFFADYKNTPEEGFLYWENKGDLKFEPFSFKDVTAGRWLTMDAGDVDGDGDVDIVLGNANFFMGVIPVALKNKLRHHSPSVIILSNTLQ